MKYKFTMSISSYFRFRRYLQKNVCQAFPGISQEQPKAIYEYSFISLLTNPSAIFTDY